MSPRAPGGDGGARLHVQTAQGPGTLQSGGRRKEHGPPRKAVLVRHEPSFLPRKHNQSAQPPESSGVQLRGKWADGDGAQEKEWVQKAPAEVRPDFEPVRPGKNLRDPLPKTTRKLTTHCQRMLYRKASLGDPEALERHAIGQNQESMWAREYDLKFHKTKSVLGLLEAYEQ